MYQVALLLMMVFSIVTVVNAFFVGFLLHKMRTAGKTIGNIAMTVGASITLIGFFLCAIESAQFFADFL